MSLIENRHGKRIAVLVEIPERSRGLAFVMHGLGGFKEQDHIRTFAEAFMERGFTVVRFDVRNTIGESEGRYEDATVTSYYEDLEDVIAWARTQEWFQEPFALCGHSLGGLCTALYAEKHPSEVLALAPISTVISGTLNVEAKKRADPVAFAEWERTGWQGKRSSAKPDVTLRLPWSFITDVMKYDLLPDAGKLTMPVLLMVGDQDTSTPPDQIRQLYDAISGPKAFHLIPGAPHTFRSPEDLVAVKAVLLEWIGNSGKMGK